MPGGGGLRTWSYPPGQFPVVEQVQVVLSADDDYPLDADIELWHGPDSTPCKMHVNVEHAPFSAVIATLNGPNTLAIRNHGMYDFPLAATVVASDVDKPSLECLSNSKAIQGGAVRTFPLDPCVDSVQVLLRTPLNAGPLNARVEILQNRNNNKPQVIELCTEDGHDRPFFCSLETPGPGNVIRVVNTAPADLRTGTRQPMTASVVAHCINEGMSANGQGLESVDTTMIDELEDNLAGLYTELHHIASQVRAEEEIMAAKASQDAEVARQEAEVLNLELADKLSVADAIRDEMEIHLVLAEQLRAKVPKVDEEGEEKHDAESRRRRRQIVAVAAKAQADADGAAADAERLRIELDQATVEADTIEGEMERKMRIWEESANFSRGLKDGEARRRARVADEERAKKLDGLEARQAELQAQIDTIAAQVTAEAEAIAQGKKWEEGEEGWGEQEAMIESDVAACCTIRGWMSRQVDGFAKSWRCS